MAKKGLKLKELARELGVSSRELVDRCRANGLPVQNSVSRITIEMERIIRGWYEDVEQPSGATDG